MLTDIEQRRFEDDLVAARKEQAKYIAPEPPPSEPAPTKPADKATAKPAEKPAKKPPPKVTAEPVSSARTIY
jgi:hypothetical protein